MVCERDKVDVITLRRAIVRLSRVSEVRLKCVFQLDRGAGGRESGHESSSKRHCRRGDHTFPCVDVSYSGSYSVLASGSTSERAGERLREWH